MLRELPATIPDNPTLDQLKTAQELYLLGVHVEQYRDPAIRPRRLLAGSAAPGSLIICFH